MTMIPATLKGNHLRNEPVLLTEGRFLKGEVFQYLLRINKPGGGGSVSGSISRSTATDGSKFIAFNDSAWGAGRVSVLWDHLEGDGRDVVFWFDELVTFESPRFCWFLFNTKRPSPEYHMYNDPTHISGAHIKVAVHGITAEYDAGYDWDSPPPRTKAIKILWEQSISVCGTYDDSGLKIEGKEGGQCLGVQFPAGTYGGIEIASIFDFMALDWPPRFPYTAYRAGVTSGGGTVLDEFVDASRPQSFAHPCSRGELGSWYFIDWSHGPAQLSMFLGRDSGSPFQDYVVPRPCEP